jgi:hypothetical protein
MRKLAANLTLKESPNIVIPFLFVLLGLPT